MDRLLHALDRRRGHRPRQAHGHGRRPRHTLPGKLTAAILHDRHGLPQKAILRTYAAVGSRARRRLIMMIMAQ